MREKWFIKAIIVFTIVAKIMLLPEFIFADGCNCGQDFEMGIAVYTPKDDAQLDKKGSKTSGMFLERGVYRMAPEVYLHKNKNK